MGLKGDIEEVRRSWVNSSWWYRSFLLISGFLAISSIASLSEIIIKWRGFFGDAILFYDEWISLPVRQLFLSMEINLDQSDVNIFIISTLWIGIVCRGFLHDFNSQTKKEKHITFCCIAALLSTIFCKIFFLSNKYHETLSTNTVNDIQSWLIMSTFFIIGGLISITGQLKPQTKLKKCFQYSTIGLLISLCIVIYYYFLFRPHELFSLFTGTYRKYSTFLGFLLIFVGPMFIGRKMVKICYTQVFILLFVVAIMGAISSGFAK